MHKNATVPNQSGSLSSSGGTKSHGRTPTPTSAADVRSARWLNPGQPRLSPVKQKRGGPFSAANGPLNPLTSLALETVGFEAYFPHYLGWHSLDFAGISTNTRAENHVDARCIVSSCGQSVGNSRRRLKAHDPETSFRRNRRAS